MVKELIQKILYELTPFKYKATETHLILWCPFCDDVNHTHAHLYLDKESLKWHCFLCGASGDKPFNLLEKYGIHINYYDYINLYLKNTEILDEPKIVNKAQNIELDDLIKNQKNVLPDTQAYQYLKNRLISDYDISTSFRLWDKYPDYVFWVYTNDKNKIIFYIGRNYKNPSSKYKYLNAKNLSVPFVVFHFDNPIFSFKEQQYGVFLVEGIFDAYGIPFSAIPLFSKNINSILVNDISKYCFANNYYPIIAVDSDAEKERYEIAQKLFNKGINKIGLFKFKKGEKDFGENTYKYADYKVILSQIKIFNPYLKRI